MEQITQTRTIPVKGSYDIVVCGGGPAGWIAAVAAARSGAKTAMIEQLGFPGGMATAGLVLPISVFTYNGKLVCGGIPWEFVQRMVELGGVETDKLIVDHHNRQGVNMHHVPIQTLLRELSRTEDVPQFGGPWFCHILHDGFTLVNASRTTVNMVDPVEASAAECRLREDVHKLTALLKKHVPEFRNCYLAYTATVAGTRETRHIQGVHVLTGEEYLNRVPFADSVARSAHPIDIHSAADSQQRCTFLEDAAYIPYRSLIVPGYDNLIVPSRCLSADQIASASIRVQAPIMCLGQAAGLAAAMCARDGISVHDVDVPALQSTLRTWGAAI